jgi:hypothetical protein
VHPNREQVWVAFASDQLIHNRWAFEIMRHMLVDDVWARINNQMVDASGRRSTDTVMEPSAPTQERKPMTSAKIDKLTPEQEALLPVWRDKWIEIGLKTGAADRDLAEEGVCQAYRSAGLPEPKAIIWADSPLEGARWAAWMENLDDAPTNWQRAKFEAGKYAVPRDAILNQINTAKITRDMTLNQLSNAVYGQHDAGWLSFYDYMGEVLGLTEVEPLHGVMKVAKSAGWWWPFDKACVMSERPIHLSRDPQDRMHNPDGYAIEYPDGFGVAMWHGTRVPIDMLTTGWDIKRTLREENTEVRRCAIEKYGWDRFIYDAKLKAVGKEMQDPGNPGYTLSLWDLPERIYGDEDVRVLLCTNATIERDGTRRRFGLTVPAEMPNALAAAAWTFGKTEREYADLLRAC